MQPVPHRTLDTHRRARWPAPACPRARLGGNRSARPDPARIRLGDPRRRGRPAQPQPAPPDESEEGNETPNPSTRPATAPPSPTPTGARAGAGRVRHRRRPGAVRRHGQGVPAALHGPASARLSVGLQVRAGAPAHRPSFLNGAGSASSIDPYTPFEIEAKGLAPGRPNELLVYVDSRKDPRLPEGWWNWGGITRPVSLVPAGRVELQRPRPAVRRDAAAAPATRCRGVRARGRHAVQAARTPAPSERDRKGKQLPCSQPRADGAAALPGGQRHPAARSRLRGSPRARARQRRPSDGACPRLSCGRPSGPQLYEAEATLSYRGRTRQSRAVAIGLRSVDVSAACCYLNNRRDPDPRRVDPRGLPRTAAPRSTTRPWTPRCAS